MKVGVVIATYNRAYILREAVNKRESPLHQTPTQSWLWRRLQHRHESYNRGRDYVTRLRRQVEARES